MKKKRKTIKELHDEYVKYGILLKPMLKEKKNGIHKSVS